MSRVSVEVLEDLMTAALSRRGVPREQAAAVARALADTSLRGVDTHGVRLFPVYLRELEGGRAVATPEMRCEDSGASARLDAGGALGIVAGLTAAEHAVRLARTFGIGFVAVGSSNHFGAAGIYTRAIAREGMIGLAFSNSDALVAPFNGSRPLFGTNPLSLAVAGEDGDELCIDMATSQVSFSRTMTERARGSTLPRGWAVTADGSDAADRPDETVAALQPLGGHKGQCLAIVVELLCAILADGPLDHELSHLYEPPYDRPRRISHAMLAIDASRHLSRARLSRRVSELLRAIRSAPASGDAPVQAPGDPEQQQMAERRARGIPLSNEELDAFRAIASEDPDGAGRFELGLDRADGRP